jgi:hypothetical protein
MKHVDIDYHMVRDMVNLGRLSFYYIPTHENIEDIFTKVLPQPAFICHRLSLGLIDLPDPRWGGVFSALSFIVVSFLLDPYQVEEEFGKYKFPNWKDLADANTRGGAGCVSEVLGMSDRVFYLSCILIDMHAVCYYLVHVHVSVV